MAETTKTNKTSKTTPAKKSSTSKSKSSATSSAKKTSSSSKTSQKASAGAAGGKAKAAKTTTAKAAKPVKKTAATAKASAKKAAEPVKSSTSGLGTPTVNEIREAVKAAPQAAVKTAEAKIESSRAKGSLLGKAADGVQDVAKKAPVVIVTVPAKAASLAMKFGGAVATDVRRTASAGLKKIKV